MTPTIRFILGLAAMAILLLGPGILIFAIEGHPVKILAGSHWLPLTILKNKWMDIFEGSIGLLALIGSGALFSLFLRQRHWWVVLLTGIYVLGQMAVLLLFLNIGPLQT